MAAVLGADRAGSPGAATLVSLVFAFVPAIAWVAFFYSRDRYEPEPKGLIIKLFVIGAIPVTLVALILNTAAAITVGYLIVALVIAPVLEETLKYLGYTVTTRNDPNLNEPVDGMIYGSAVGFGFAAAENVNYFIHAYLGQTPAGASLGCHVLGTACVLSIAPVRILATALVHGTATGIGGYFFAQRVLAGRRSSFAWQGLLIAIGLHMLWNVVGGWFPLIILVHVYLYFWLLRRALLRSPFRIIQLVRTTGPGGSPRP